MYRHRGILDVETATAWLTQHEWGADVIKLLSVDTAADRLDRWLGTIVAMHSAMLCPGIPIFDQAASVANWAFERAAKWVRRFPFGERLIEQLAAGPEPDRSEQFLSTVSGIHAARYGSAPDLQDRLPDSDEDLDAAMWPALIADIY